MKSISMWYLHDNGIPQTFQDPPLSVKPFEQFEKKPYFIHVKSIWIENKKHQQQKQNNDKKKQTNKNKTKQATLKLPVVIFLSFLIFYTNFF